LATVISQTRWEFAELKPELLDDTQSGFEGLALPVLLVSQELTGIFEVNNSDVAQFHAGK
jgi:hypothetical protein